MPKVDFKKELKHLYAPSAKQPEMVDIPVMNFLMLDGTGDPNNSESFEQAVEALYGVSYALKFMVKEQAEDMDYVVPPLEGLWWCDSMELFDVNRKDLWKWTMMIMQPPQITTASVGKAIEKTARKKELRALSQLRFEPYVEGKSAQIMHLGPFADEHPTILKLHTYIEQQGFQRHGKHHEIYLSDPRRAEPSKMKTILRQPVK